MLFNLIAGVILIILAVIVATKIDTPWEKFVLVIYSFFGLSNIIMFSWKIFK